jgi:hypothetical protein
LKKDKEAHKLMKQMLKSLGNPGLMGMGRREPDRAKFLKAKNELLKSIGG